MDEILNCKQFFDCKNKAWNGTDLVCYTYNELQYNPRLKKLELAVCFLQIDDGQTFDNAFRIKIKQINNYKYLKLRRYNKSVRLFVSKFLLIFYDILFVIFHIGFIYLYIENI